MYGNQYSQVFANNAYFANVYPMDYKSKAGDDLNFFVKILV